MSAHNATASRRWKTRLCFLLFYILTISLLFRDAVFTIVASWRQDEYSHGYLLVVVAMLLLLNKIENLKEAPHNSWAGAALVTLCILIKFVLGVAGVEGILPELYFLAIVGAVTTFWGVKNAAAMAGPLTFLFFCAPLPKFFYYTLSFNMQMLSTSLGTWLLELLAIPVYQDGNIIDLGGYRLQVAQACSGLRYLFPLLSLSYLFAYLYKAAFFKRVVLFVSALPIAVVMNSLRIALIGVTVDRWGTRMAEGLVHQVEGWMVFLGCALCLACELWVLQHIGRRAELRTEEIRLPRWQRLKAPPANNPARASFAVMMALMLMATTLPLLQPGHLKDIPLKQPFAEFPVQLGKWIGHFAALDADALKALGAADYLLADYARPGAPPVNVYALYYAHQDSTSNEAVHSPSVCIPGGGWTVETSSSKRVILDSKTSLAVNRIVIVKGGAREMVYYWFIQGGKVTTGYNMSKFAQVRNALLTGTTNGAMVRLTTPVAPGESDNDAEKRLEGFLNAGLETLNNFMFPDGK